ncbi:MAG TPA: hypothetical protein IGR15_02965 [Synechococcus sp. M44_DOE_062]|nr:hypothetical protein [Synechococcus sp. M44_DOE_062]
MKSLLTPCIIAPQRYCYAYGTLTGTATLTRRCEDATNVLGGGTVS